mgnify:CR=1 FL=1
MLTRLKEISETVIEEIRTIVGSIISILVFFYGHSVLNKLFETPDSFLFYYIVLPLTVTIPPVAINLLYFKKHLHKLKIPLNTRIGLGLWLSLIVIMNMIPLSLTLLIELPYHTHWSVEHGYYQGKHTLENLEWFLIFVSIYNFYLWHRRIKIEKMRLYQMKIPIFSKS